MKSTWSALGPASATAPDEELLPVELDDEEEREELGTELPLLVVPSEEVDERVALEARLPVEVVVRMPDALALTLASRSDWAPPRAPVHAPRLQAITPKVAHHRRSNRAGPADDQQFKSMRSSEARKPDANALSSVSDTLRDWRRRWSSGFRGAFRILRAGRSWRAHSAVGARAIGRGPRW
jgi:hypothetical protein